MSKKNPVGTDDLVQCIREKAEEEFVEVDNAPKRRSTFLAFLRAFLITVIVLGTISLVCLTFDFYHEPNFEISTSPIQPLSYKPFSSHVTKVPLPGTVEKQKDLSPNVKGFLTVDGVNVIEEAVLQHPTQDEYYLTHNEYDEKDIWGTYYTYHDWHMDSAEGLDKVTVIFGHSNGNSLHRKFSVLKKFKDAEFAKQHQFIYLQIGETKTIWQIFAAADYPISNNYVVANPSNEEFSRQMAKIKSYSYNHYDVDVDERDKVLILSTCSGHNTYDTRYIVAAKLISCE